jgi:molecular chaperone GrpE
MSASEEQSQAPVTRDGGRIDPVTDQPGHQAQPDSAPSGTTQPGEPEPGGAQSAEPAQAARATGQTRPGKHAVSKPGLRADASGSGQAAGQEPAGAGQQRQGGEPDAPGGAAQVRVAEPDLKVKLAERTADLQRVQAEYANYRKRVERDRAAVREHALASVLAELLPVLDDIGRAREHGELTGGFKSVAESLEATTVKLGLTAFGEAGEAFDPNVHEALMHAYSADVTEPTCVQILQPGYRVGERVLRPARVSVAEPTDPSGARPGGDAAGGLGQESGADEAEESSTADPGGVSAPADSPDSADSADSVGPPDSAPGTD